MRWKNFVSVKSSVKSKPPVLSTARMTPERAAMFTDNRFRFDLLRAERAFSRISSRERRDEPSDRPKQDWDSDRAADPILLFADQVTNDGVNEEPENDPFHVLGRFS
jgi:hypothetical protein